VYKWPVPEKRFTLSNQIKRTVLTSWINVLLVCVPIGQCLHFVRGQSPETFAFNYVAQFPLWFMCDYALEEIEKYLGWAASDLLDIFTNNTVQVISGYLLLKAKKVSLLQTSLVGGILSNILFLLGLSYFLGGIENHEQGFNRISAQGSSSLLSIAATSLLIPTAVKHLHQTTPENLVLQSRGVAFVLLFVYFAYTICQMVTHKEEYNKSGKEDQPAVNQSSLPSSSHLNSIASGSLPEGEVSIGLVGRGGARTAQPADEPGLPTPDGAKHGSSEITDVHLRLDVATLVFVATIVGLYFCIDSTVGSISALTERTSLSQTFVGLILLPIPNCDFAPVSLAIDDHAEQTMKYTVGRSIQTALLVEPLAVLTAWWMRVQGLTLAFDGFEVVSLFTTILLLNFLIVDAKVHWVHGMLLLADFALIGIAAFFVTPEKS
jgi:Ca2+:H+ antiporter